MLPYGLFDFRRTRCSVSTGQPVHFHRTVHAVADARIEIALPDGVAVRVGAGFDAAALQRVLQVLGR